MIRISIGGTDSYTPVIRTSRHDTARKVAMELLERAVQLKMDCRAVKVQFQGRSLPDRKRVAK